MQEKSLKLKNKALGPLPIIDAFLKKLELSKILSEAVGRQRYVATIEILVKNILTQPNALYRVNEWSKNFDPILVKGGGFSDDVIARSLDRLFESDRASLLTRLIVETIKRFDISTDRIHSDTTTIKFSGRYARQSAQAVQLKRGHSKDHRPDLKQLVYSLCVSSDGAVPIHFKAYDGNRTDEGIHWETWQALRGLLGRSDFLYVGDSKLCTHNVMTNIDREQGKFICMMPRTRSEYSKFSERALHSLIRWERIYAKRCSRRSNRLDIFEEAQELTQMQEGFRLFWYRSSEKKIRDEEDREDRLSSAISRLKLLNEQRRRGPKTAKALKRSAAKILNKCGVEDFVDIKIEILEIEKFKQTVPGKPTVDTAYRRIVQSKPNLVYQLNTQALSRAKAMDGIFPLATNSRLSGTDILKAYKYQPKVEKRHRLFKSVLQVSPIFLKKNDRIEGLIFVYFIGQMIASLIERTIRKAMDDKKIADINILPEDRPTRAPSVEQIFRIFEHRQRHELYQKHKLLKCFVDPLSQSQGHVLDLLGLNKNIYL